MIYIFYIETHGKLKIETFNDLLDQLPSSIKIKILKFRKWQDALRSLLGLALLIEGLKYLGLNSCSLNDLRYTEFHRPYFDNSIDFNISHSSEFIICGISRTNRLGVDIEEIQEIPIFDFESQFSKTELEEIMRHENSMRAFYSLWTQKEAFLKAVGKGLQVPLNSVAIEDGKITWENQEWYIYEIKLDQRYVSHLATDAFSPKIEIKKLDFY